MDANNTRRLLSQPLTAFVAGCVAGLFVTASSFAQEGVLEAPPAGALADAPEGEATPGMEVLTRGPIHEAFAEPVVRDPAPGLKVLKPPPEALKETPPDVKPEGEN